MRHTTDASGIAIERGDIVYPSCGWVVQEILADGSVVVQMPEDRGLTRLVVPAKCVKKLVDMTRVTR